MPKHYVVLLKGKTPLTQSAQFAVMFFLSFSGEASLTCAGLQQQMVEEGEEDLSVLPAAAKN